MLKAYYHLTKPGIIYGNAINAVGGFLFASRGHVDLGLLLAVIIGTSMVIASACVFNNYIDQGIDKKMARTKKRALVSGVISGRSALLYASALGIAGFVVLGLWVNALTLCLGLIAFFDYIVLYGLSKRNSVHGTIVGSIAGAMPVVAGYTAVTGTLDRSAFLLFLILVLWQMPHFYAIAMFRLKDYTAAHIPVLPVKSGLRSTKIHIIAYVAAFTLAVSMLTVFSSAGYTYLLVMVLLGTTWVIKGIKGFGTSDDTMWARKMFFFSLLVILMFSVMLSLNVYLP